MLNDIVAAQALSAPAWFFITKFWRSIVTFKRLATAFLGVFVGAAMTAANAADVEITINNNDTGGQSISVGVQDCSSQLTCNAPPLNIPSGGSATFTANLNTTASIALGAVTLNYGRFQKRCRVTLSDLAINGQFESPSGNTFAIEGFPPDIPSCTKDGDAEAIGGDMKFSVTFR